MAYTTKDATNTLLGYLNLNPTDVEFVEGTNNRAFIYKNANNEKSVIFIYPISHKQDNSKNFFDTRDSGARERGIAWNYAVSNKLKYFCFAVHDQVERYKDYIFSLESDENKIEEVSGTLEGARNGKGTQVVIPNDYVPNRTFDRIKNQLGFYIAVIEKGHIDNYINMFDNRPYLLNDDIIDIADSDDFVSENNSYTFDTSKGGAQNRVVYGTPGCGKSYYVQNTYLDKIGVSEENRIRTTFYQDYTNTDFVGQILPKIVRAQNEGEKDEVTYEFNPGPFALALKMAIEYDDEPIALIIEELNRGNAASIFGDIFQLLDRDKNGKSQYSITNINLQDYLTKEFAEKSYIFNSISIPGNLYIVATMNTSDQNVFTLDTAFKRRWQFEKLRNKFTDDHEYKNYTIPGMDDITWEQLVTDINAFIVSRADDLASEDKQLGVYFIAKENLYAPGEEASEEKVKTFAYKLFEYLWDDVAKFSRVDWFGDIKTLDDLIDKYISEGKKVFVDGIIQQNN